MDRGASTICGFNRLLMSRRRPSAAKQPSQSAGASLLALEARGPRHQLDCLVLIRPNYQAGGS
jgi:hypothetical protein